MKDYNIFSSGHSNILNLHLKIEWVENAVLTWIYIIYNAEPIKIGKCFQNMKF